MAKGRKPKASTEPETKETVTEAATLSTGNVGSVPMSSEKQITYVIPMNGSTPRLESLDLHAVLQGVEQVSYVISEKNHVITVTEEIAELETDEAKAAGIHRR